jgi:type VI secretion system ImpM family protein
MSPPDASGHAVSAAGAPVVGWFGKVPALGDFVVRRLPSGFRDRWDPWLSAGLLEGAAALGEAWPDTYLAFPFWRFLWIEPLGTTAWAGVLAPGADRVGRLFPVTVVQAITDPLQRVPSFEGLDRWMDEVEAHLLALLTDDDVERFERALRPFVWPATGAVPGAAREPGLSFEIDADGATPAEVATALALQRLGAADRTLAWFWSRDADGAVHTRVLGGAPSPGWFVGLVHRPAPAPADRSADTSLHR